MLFATVHCMQVENYHEATYSIVQKVDIFPEIFLFIGLWPHNLVLTILM